MIIQEADYDIGQEVYLKTDKDSLPRIITAILITPGGLQYKTASGNTEYWAYAIELSKEKVVNPEIAGS